MAALTDRILDMPLPYEQSPYEPQQPYDFVLYPPFDTYHELLSQEAISAVHQAHQTYTAVDQSPQTPPHPSTHDVSGQLTAIVPAGADPHFTLPGTCGLPEEVTALKAPHVLDIPSASVPPSAEFPPSTISWVSGASIASAASSTLGSPSSGASQTVPRSDPWATDIHGLGIDPFNQDGLVSTGFGTELAFANDKCPTGYVGECARVSSSSAADPVRAMSLHRHPSSSSFHPVSCLPSSWPTGVPTPPRGMLESIPEHATPSGGELGTGWSPSTAVSVGECTTPQATADTLTFRVPALPTTPRLARPARPRRPRAAPGTPYPPPSPVISIPRRPSSATLSSISPTTPRTMRPPRSAHHLSQSPFFMQSSGHFTPPLNFSCWFPTLSAHEPDGSSSFASPLCTFEKRSSHEHER